MSHLVSLIERKKLYAAARNEDVGALLEYIDYLEGVARDFHNYAAMMSRAALGTAEVEATGVWKPAPPVKMADVAPAPASYKKGTKRKK